MTDLDSAMRHLEHASPEELEVYLRASEAIYNQFQQEYARLMTQEEPQDTTPVLPE